MKRQYIMWMLLLTNLGVGLSCTNNSTNPLDNALTNPSSSINDCLPLHVGFHYVYYYQLNHDHRDGMSMRSSTVDTGNVEYTILDSLSTLNGKTQWSVLENAHLVHRYWPNYLRSQIPDSEYIIDSSTPLTLTEETSGSHQLQIASRVWLFPLREIHFSMTDSVAVMRYSSSTPRLLTLYLDDQTQMHGAQDTMRFESLRGLTRFYSYSNVGSNYTGDSYTLSAQLR
jgi:hypothetical protein